MEQLVLTELDSVLKVYIYFGLFKVYELIGKEFKQSFTLFTLFVQSDLPAIASGRKQLDRLILELDTAKARLKTAREVLFINSKTLNL